MKRGMCTGMRMAVLPLAVSVSACATHAGPGGIPSPFPGAPTARSAGRAAGSTSALTAPAALIIETALSLEGRPYQFGGADPSGFDCSGLVWYVFLQHQVRIPRTTAEQARVGLSIDPAEVEPGDLLFFSTTSSGPSHVGIAVDRHTLVHAPSTGNAVRVERFDTPYWRSRLVGARRVARSGDERY